MGVGRGEAPGGGEISPADRKGQYRKVENGPLSGRGARARPPLWRKYTAFGVSIEM